MSVFGALALMAEASSAAPICADRPAKANAVCTVPAGDFQLETGLASWSEASSGGDRSASLQLGSSLLKVGLSDHSDFEFGLTPWIRQTIGSSGTRAESSGFGDALVRYKHRLTKASAPVQVAVLPFVKLPTADHALGNGKVEGGVALPVSFSLGGLMTMTLGPELDVLADSDLIGRHISVVNAINVSGPIDARLTLTGELWANLNFDPAGMVRQATADVAFAYAVSNRLQLDSGLNFGLTRNTADVEIYAGASLLF